MNIPSAKDAEQGLISSFLISPKEVGRLCAENGIHKDHFHFPAHQIIFDHLFCMWGSDSLIDFIVLTTRLSDYGELDKAGGAAFVTSLFTLIPTASLAEEYISILQEKRLLRQIIFICNEYAHRSREEQHQVSHILSEIQGRIAALGSGGSTRIPTMKENILAAVDVLEGRVSSNGSVVMTGLNALDSDAGPLERGNLLVIGGQTKAGKSMLATQIALNIAMSKKPVLYISLEMNEQELTLRLLSILARVDVRKVKEWNEFEHGRFAAAQNTLLGVPFHIATRKFKLSEVVAISQQYASKPQGLGAIVFDYAQIAEGKIGAERRQQEVAEISRTCKRIAGSLDVLFILLTQLNDEGRSRESRDIENDCNMMLEVGHNKETGERGVKVVLARSAPSGHRLKLRIIPEHTRVEDAPEMTFEPEERKPKAKFRNFHKD